MLKKLIMLVCVSSTLIANSNAYASISDLDSAKKSIKVHEFRTATIHLKNYLKQSPEDASARFLLGDIYLMTGDLKASVKELGRAHKLAPDNEEYLFQYAEGLLRSGQNKKLIELLGSSDSDAKKIAYLGYAELGLNEINKAQESFIQSNKVKNNAMAINGLATIALNQEALPKGLDFINQALVIEPDNVRSLRLKARYFTLNNQPKEAKIVFDNLINKNKNNVDAYIGRGAVQILLKNTNEAIKDFKIALSKNSMHPEANSLLAQILLKKNDFKGAQNSAQKVVDILPNDPAALLTLGTSLLKLNKLYQADTYLNKYLLLYPDDVKTINMLALNHLNNRDPKKAISIIERASPELINQSTSLLYTLSNSNLAIGNISEGITLLQQARKLSPNNSDIKKLLISAQLENGQGEEVIKQLESMFSAKTANKMDQYLLIQAYLTQNKLDKANLRLQQFLKNSPNDLALRNSDALISQLKGDIDIAYQKYTDILRSEKDNSAAQRGVAQYYVEKTRQLIAKKDYAGANAFIKKLPSNSKNTQTVLQADIYRAQRQFSKALPLYQQAFKNTSSPVVLKSLITVMIKLYKTDEAIKLLSNITKKNPKDINLLKMLAGLYQVTNQSDKLKNTYQKILILSPYDTAVLNNLSWMIYKKDLNKAISMAKLANTHAPNVAAYKDTYGYYLTLKGDYKAGLLVLQEAAKLEPSDAGTQYHIAIALNKMGKKKSAIDILKKITSGSNNFIEFREASLLLKSIE